VKATRVHLVAFFVFGGIIKIAYIINLKNMSDMKQKINLETTPDDSQQQGKKEKSTIGIFGIITNGEDEVLLVHRKDYDLWNLPGGGLEAAEAPWDGVVREVKEETGLDVEVSKLLGVYSKAHKNEIVFSFECKIVSGELTLNKEASDIRYFDKQNLPQNMSPKQVERINDYFQDKNGITMKVQEGKTTIELIKEGKL